METPIPRILLALDGKMEFVKLTNPFGSGGGDGDKGKAPKALDRPPTDEERVEIARNLRAVLGGKRRGR